MVNLNEIFQSADWKKEKHVPVIEILEKKENRLNIKCTVGKEIVHPNTTEHHISWMELYFLPKGEKFPYLVNRTEFTSHGESVNGPNTSSIYTEPSVVITFKTEKPGTIIAFSYCNIHGLWQNSLEL